MIKTLGIKIKSLEKEWKNIIFNLCFALLTLLIPVFLYKKILSTTITLMIIAVIGLIKYHSKISLAVFLFGALFGAIAEIIAIKYGLWNYTLSNFMNIPSWLFIFWGNVAVFIYQTAIELERLGIHYKK